MIKLLTLCTFIMAASAFAQSPVVLLNGGTNNVPADTTNAVNLVLGRFPGSVTAVGADIKLAGAGTAGVLFTFQAGIDGSNWDTAKTFTLRANGNGTSVNTTITNFTVSGYPYLKLVSIANSNATAVTNLTVKYTIKDGF
jgi:hypothetical protein